MGVFKCDGAHFRRDCKASKNAGKQSQAKAIKASHGPRVRAKERLKRTMENPKGSLKDPKMRCKFPKGSVNGKTLKTGISSLENLKSETSSENLESAQMGQVCITEMSLI